MKWVSERLREFREKEAADVVSIFIFTLAIIAFAPNRTLLFAGLIIFWLAVFTNIFELNRFKGRVRMTFDVILNVLLVAAILLGLLASYRVFQQW